MGKYRKNPISIEAIQWFEQGDHPEVFPHPIMPEKGAINTLEGPLAVSKGDWIIKGVQGEFYPCKPDIFEETYEEINMDFSEALLAIKAGNKVGRVGWNGKNMFIFMVLGSTFKVNRAPLLGIYEEGTEVNYHAHIDMKTADDMVVPWLCSQTDIFATDWEIV